MLHFVAKVLPGRLMFCTHAEALFLWTLLVRYAPSPVAGFLMPNHFHWFHRYDIREALVIVLRAYARSWNHRRGTSGQLWQPLPDAPVIEGRLKVQRSIRYIELNGCRAGLHDNPLSWSWSSHRDAVGLAADPVRPVVPDPHRHHAYVSADPSVDVSGTELPTGIGRPLSGLEGLRAVQAAVSEMIRRPFADLRRRGPARMAFIRAARAHTTCSTREIADFIGVGPRTVRRVEIVDDPVVRLVGRVLCDPRFPGLHDGDLSTDPRWRRYLG